MIVIGHLSATVVVFIFSRIYRNSSLYDPFWSVAPIPIAIYLSLYPETGEINTTKVFLITAPILFWGIRLTLNWARDWKGLIDEDFRYISLKEKPFAILIDLFGIHIYPTLQVNLSLLPIYFSLSLSNADVNIWLVIASLFTCLSVVLETVADEQMRKFRRNKENLGKTMRKGIVVSFKTSKLFRRNSFLVGSIFYDNLFRSQLLVFVYLPAHHESNVFAHNVPDDG